MVKLLVLYGHPKDPAAFDKYYQEVHIPLAKRMQGLKKWTIGKVLGDVPASDRLFGTVATTAIGIMNGADIIRVHDVKENAQAARMSDAVVRGYDNG